MIFLLYKYHIFKIIRYLNLGFHNYEYLKFEDVRMQEFKSSKFKFLTIVKF